MTSIEIVSNIVLSVYKINNVLYNCVNCITTRYYTKIVRLLSRNYKIYSNFVQFFFTIIQFIYSAKCAKL